MPTPPRKPLARIEGRRTLRPIGVVAQWRGTPGADDWVAFIANIAGARRLILADGVSERRVKSLLSRIARLPRRDITRLAKG